ncbi:MAG: hypothetical protein ABGY75_17195, partial [Gemmataceae bacterium]
VKPDGVEVFRAALKSAEDALEFKLNQMLAKEPTTTVDGARRVVDAVLSIMALAPPVPSQAGQVRQQLIVTRIAHRLGLRQETVWARLTELKAERRRAERTQQAKADAPTVVHAGPAARPRMVSAEERLERQLLELLLAEPGLVGQAKPLIPLEAIQHTGLRRVLGEMYRLHDTGVNPDMDAVRVQLIDRPDLVDAAVRLQEVGRHAKDRPELLTKIVGRFSAQPAEAEKRAVKEALASGPTDEEATLELLRRIQGGRK